MRFSVLRSVSITLLILLSTAIAGTAQDNKTFCGQNPPGSVPVCFVPDVFADEKYPPHGSLTFSVDETQIFWSAFLSEGSGQTILFSEFNGKKLSKPQAAPFAITSDRVPCFSYDGNRLYFTSSGRPIPGGGDGSSLGIWYVERSDGAWGEPAVLKDLLDASTVSAQATISKSGNLYFGLREESETLPNLYWSRLTSKGYSAPELLRGRLGSEYANGDAFVDPDERYILFFSAGRSDGIGSLDIYISFRQKDGSWGEATNLGTDVNSEHFERFPSVSRDGEYLFFVRSVGSEYPGEEISYYWVDAKVIKELCPTDLECFSLKIKPKAPSIGGNITLAVRVKNNSSFYSASTTVDFYLSDKKKLDKKSILLGSCPIDSLKPGKKRKIKVGTTIPETVKSEDYYLSAVVDGDDLNYDPSKGNNIVFSAKMIPIR
jgi:hypothetical protein